MKVSGKIGSSGALVSDSVEKRFEPDIHTYIHTYILTVVIVGNLINVYWQDSRYTITDVML